MNRAFTGITIDLKAAEIAFPFIKSLPSRRDEYAPPVVEISRLDEAFHGQALVADGNDLYVSYHDERTVPVAIIPMPGETVGAALARADLRKARLVLLHEQGSARKLKDTGVETHNRIIIKMMGGG